MSDHLKYTQFQIYICFHLKSTGCYSSINHSRAPEKHVPSQLNPCNPSLRSLQSRLKRHASCITSFNFSSSLSPVKTTKRYLKCCNLMTSWSVVWKHRVDWAVSIREIIESLYIINIIYIHTHIHSKGGGFHAFLEATAPYAVHIICVEVLEAAFKDGCGKHIL